MQKKHNPQQYKKTCFHYGSTTQEEKNENFTSTKMKQETMNTKNYKQSMGGLVGLSNIGNTCFMNATLQCLFNLPGFNHTFLTGQYKKQIRRGGAVSSAYAQTIYQIRKRNSGSLTPSEIKSAVSSKKTRFRGYAQQDAQQFMTAILELMSIELNRSQKQKYRSLTADLSKKTLEQISDQWWHYHKQRQDSIITDYFSSQMMSLVICSKCQTQQLSFDNTCDLSLSFDRTSYGMKLVDLISNYFQQETLDGDYFCSKCKKLKICTKKNYLYRLPKIFVLHLKRFSFGKWYKSKLNNKVRIEEYIDLKNFIGKSKHQSTKNSRFQLVGIVNHSGEIDYGHYTAKCKNPINKKWYSFNDSWVNESSLSGSFDSSEAYLLFYSQS